MRLLCARREVRSHAAPRGRRGVGWRVVAPSSADRRVGTSSADGARRRGACSCGGGGGRERRCGHGGGARARRAAALQRTVPGHWICVAVYFARRCAQRSRVGLLLMPSCGRPRSAATDCGAVYESSMCTLSHTSSASRHGGDRVWTVVVWGDRVAAEPEAKCKPARSKKHICVTDQSDLTPHRHSSDLGPHLRLSVSCVDCGILGAAFTVRVPLALRAGLFDPLAQSRCQSYFIYQINLYNYCYRHIWRNPTVPTRHTRQRRHTCATLTGPTERLFFSSSGVRAPKSSRVPRVAAVLIG